MSYILKYLPLLLFYLIGSFPTGYLVAKLNGIDIRSSGSGNVGATNVARTLGKKAGVLTLVLDILKGFFVVLVAGYISSGNEFFMALAGLFCVLGHCYSLPPFLSGGKGVATALGVLFGVSTTLALLTLLTFIILFALSKIVSLASVGATLFASVISVLLVPGQQAWLPIAAIAIVIVVRHKENLLRLSEGKEKKFTSPK